MWTSQADLQLSMCDNTDSVTCRWTPDTWPEILACGNISLCTVQLVGSSQFLRSCENIKRHVPVQLHAERHQLSKMGCTFIML